MSNKNAFLTFYSSSCSFVRLNNGFSFVRHLLDGDDFFVETKRGFHEILKLKVKLKKYDTIYCSLSFDEEFDSVRNIIDQRWILGGPLCLHSNLSHINCKKHVGPFEGLLKQELSTQFTDYWTKKTRFHKNKALNYSCGVGQGCYWNKCNFCDYRYYNKTCYSRNNIGQIFNSLPKRTEQGYDSVHLCVSAANPKLLREIIKSAKEQNILSEKHIIFTLFIRSDPGIINVISEFENLQGFLFAIGTEVFCQEAADILNKGIQIKDVFDLSKRIIDRNGAAILSIMNHYPFMNFKMANESIKFIEELSKLPVYGSLIHKGLSVYNNGVTYWPNKEFPSKFSKNIKEVFQGQNTHWIVELDRMSEEFLANQKISLALEQNLRIMGGCFASLDPLWTEKFRKEQLINLLKKNKK